MREFEKMGGEPTGFEPFAKTIAGFFFALREAGLPEDIADRYTEILVRELTETLISAFTTSMKNPPR